MPKNSQTRSASWTFTLNNPAGPVDREAFADLEYMVYQEEIAPGTGTRHYQGYVRFSKRKVFGAVQAMFAPAGPHLEAAKASPQKNREYCTKVSSRVPGTEPVEYGDCPVTAPGTRSDIVALRDAVKAGKPFLEIADDDGLCEVLARHMPFYNRLTTEASPPIQRPDVRVTFCVGPAGSGKSTCAGLFDAGLDTYVYDRALNGFWDGYVSQKKLIFDEMSGATLKPTEFNRICDRGPYNANIKGSSRYLACTDIRITSNNMPEKWWSAGTKWTPDALYRRIHECHYHPTTGVIHKFKSDENAQPGKRAIDKMRAYFTVMRIEEFM